MVDSDEVKERGDDSMKDIMENNVICQERIEDKVIPVIELLDDDPPDIIIQSDNLEELNIKQGCPDIVVELPKVLPSENPKISSLSVIALEYEDSNSETEHESYPTEDNECIVTADVVNDTILSNEMETQMYREIKESSTDSSDSEDDSSISSVTSEPSSEAEETNTNKGKKKIIGRKGPEQKEKELKNEWDDLPPIQDLAISMPEVLCEPLGEVAWTVDQLVVVKPKPGKPTLNLDTVLFIERGKRALGQIFDVFGQVKEPYYCVRFNSSEEITEKGIQMGMVVYFCPNTEHTSLVFLHELLKCKGIDAIGDDEPPQFSDDEEERLYYENLRRQQANKANDANIPFKRRRETNAPNRQATNNLWNKKSPRNAKSEAFQTRAEKRQMQRMNYWPPTEIRQPVFGESTPYGMYPGQMYTMPYFHPPAASEISQPNYSNEAGFSTTTATVPGASYSADTASRFPRAPPHNYAPFPNPRLRYPGMNWPSQPTSPVQMNTWVTLAPPPPPPPPDSENN